MKLALCPRCLTIRKLQGHHVVPKRFYGNKANRYGRLYICSKCHAEIEKILPFARKLTAKEYFDITETWMRGGGVYVSD